MCGGDDCKTKKYCKRVAVPGKNVFYSIEI